MITDKKTSIDKLFKAGTHFGLTKARRHPTAKKFVFGIKNKIEIIDLEKTEAALAKACEFVSSVAAKGKNILFVSSKSEGVALVRHIALKTGQPFVAGRWLGGTLTNWTEINKRINKLDMRLKEREKGELAKYTKKERLLIDREITKLERFFGGLMPMKEKPGALVIVDPKREEVAVLEALQMNVPVIALGSTDCDFSLISHPVPGNDSNTASITLFLEEIADAHTKGKLLKPEVKETK